MHLCVYVCVLCLCLNFGRKKHRNSITEIQRGQRFKLLAISVFHAQTVTQIRNLSCKIMDCQNIVVKIVVEVRLQVQGQCVRMTLIGIGTIYFSPECLYLSTGHSFLSAPIRCVILFCCKKAVGARQALAEDCREDQAQNRSTKSS